MMFDTYDRQVSPRRLAIVQSTFLFSPHHTDHPNRRRQRLQAAEKLIRGSDLYPSDDETVTDLP
jgi:hypothetical protein